MQDYKKISKYTLWALMAIGVLFSIMFYVGGSAGSLEVAGDFLNIPRFSNLFLIWNYILVCAVCLLTLAMVCWEFAKTFKADRKKAINQLCVVIGFIVLVVLCWILGSSSEVKIIGYEGTDNVGAMAKLSDACLYLTYILTVGTLGAMCWGLWHTKHVK